MNSVRITTLLVAVVASLTFAVTGCGGPVEPEQVPAVESVVASDPAAGQDSTEENVSAMATCPYMWTCDFSAYYSTKYECTAACGSTCYRDYYCHTGCLCP